MVISNTFLPNLLLFVALFMIFDRFTLLMHKNEKVTFLMGRIFVLEK